jgi:hypothetical protein
VSGRFKGGVPSVAASEPGAQAFISGAPGKASLPWNAPGVRDDVRLDLNIEISERLKLKINWLAWHTKTPKRQIGQAALEAYVNAELERLGIK